MGRGNTFLEQVTRINTDLGHIAQVLEGIRDDVMLGKMLVEEAYLDRGSDHTVIKITVNAWRNRVVAIDGQKVD